MTVISKKSPAPLRRGMQPVAAIPIVLIVIGFLCLNLYFVLPQRALDASGRRTTGTLTDFYEGEKGRLYVVYRYQVGNQTFNNRCNVRGGDFHKDQIGGPVTVTYLPDRPQVSRTEPSNEAFSAYCGFWVVVVGGIAVFVCLGVEIAKGRAGNSDSPRSR